MSEILCHLRNNLLPVYHSQLSVTEEPLWICEAKDTGLSLPLAPSGGLQYLSGKGNLPVYLISIPPPPNPCHRGSNPDKSS